MYRNTVLAFVCCEFVLQRSTLGALLFSVYINDFSDGRITKARLFADDVSLFSVVDNMNLSVTNLNSDLRRINTWANLWKISFNPDHKKQMQEVIFSLKKKFISSSTKLNHNSVQQVLFQKILGVYLNGRFDFRKNLQSMFKKVNKRNSSLRKP